MSQATHWTVEDLAMTTILRLLEELTSATLLLAPVRGTRYIRLGIAKRALGRRKRVGLNTG